jgi:hypothetical protein
MRKHKGVLSQTIPGAAIFAGLMAFSCGASQRVAPPPTVAEPEAVDEPAASGENVQVKGLWGRIDDSEVEDIMQRHFDDFLECYQYEALEILEEIEGNLSVYLIVGPDGAVTDEIYFEDGTLGSEAAQACIIGKMKRIQFHKPIGGYNAKVRYTVPFEEPYNHPAPLDWSNKDKFTAVVAEHQSEIDDCLKGKTGIQLVIYVGRGGRVEAAGATAGTQDAYEAGRCLARAAKSWTFPNPGKTRPAKAIVQF